MSFFKPNVGSVPPESLKFPIELCVGSDVHVRVFKNSAELGIDQPIFAIGTNIVLYAHYNELGNGNLPGLFYANAILSSDLLNKLEYDNDMVLLGRVDTIYPSGFEIVRTDTVLKLRNVIVKIEPSLGCKIYLREVYEAVEMYSKLYSSLLLTNQIYR